MFRERIEKLVRTALQRRGLDLVRFRSLNTVLAHHGVNVVFDVGANAGQYGRRLRELGYRGKIVSFEPQKGPFALLAAAARSDGNWTALNLGLGSEPGQQTINLYRDSVYGSILTLDQQRGIHHTEPVGTETIEIRTLDGVFDQHVTAADRILLKIDTQGFEKPVLQGAARSLPRLAGVQIEMSLTPLYHGQPRMEEMIALLRDEGFVLWQIQRGFCDMRTGQDIEADGVFMRPGAAQA